MFVRLYGVEDSLDIVDCLLLEPVVTNNYVTIRLCFAIDTSRWIALTPLLRDIHP